MNKPDVSKSEVRRQFITERPQPTWGAPIVYYDAQYDDLTTLVRGKDFEAMVDGRRGVVRRSAT